VSLAPICLQFVDLQSLFEIPTRPMAVVEAYHTCMECMLEFRHTCMEGHDRLAYYDLYVLYDDLGPGKNPSRL